MAGRVKEAHLFRDFQGGADFCPSYAMCRLPTANCRDRLVVRTLRCGRSNPGSNPGHGIFVSYIFLKIQIQPGLLEIILNGGNFFQMIQSNKNMRRPGIEPGSTAWKAAMLTIIPPTPHIALGFYLDCSRE